MPLPITKTLNPALSFSPSSRFFLPSLFPHRQKLAPSLVRAMASAPPSMFQLKVDPLTGTSQWVVIEEDQDSEPSSEPLLATTSYLDMLNDSRRNRAFRRAIEKTVTGPCHVLDIGAGTGLLSMMAAQAMKSGETMASNSEEGTVTAVESYLPMVKLMRRVLRLNGMNSRIKVINRRSDELKVGDDIASRANVLVSEILDSELLGEGLIPTLQHAHDMLLVKNPQTVPYRATIYGQLVESEFLWKLHDLYSNEAKVCDGIHLVPTGLETIVCTKSQQYALHCDAVTETKLLSEPFRIFEFDFSSRPDSQRDAEICIKTTADGRINAVISWWILQLDKEGTIFYSTAPKWVNLPHGEEHCDRDWCDHWKQCVWFIPGKGMSISNNEEVHLHCVHTDTSSSYSLKTQQLGREDKQFRCIPENYQLILSPERVAIYGDCKWRLKMSAAVKKVLQEKVSPLCVVADDSFFLTILLAHHSNTSHIISAFPGLREKGDRYLQVVADANGFSMEQVKVFGKRITQLTLQDTHQKEVDLFVGEPFYLGNEAGLPWQNLRFWKERTVLDSILSKNALVVPYKGILRACAMSLPDLWRSRCSLKDLEDFDHSVVNSTLGACGDLPAADGPCLPFFIWQCGEIKELSKAHTVLEFDFSKPIISPCSGVAKVEIINSGTCHGFVLWIDWVLDAENSIVISTGPVNKNWKQGVKLLTSPVTVGVQGTKSGAECCSSTIEASFDPDSGEITFKCEFT